MFTNLKRTVSAAILLTCIAALPQAPRKSPGGEDSALQRNYYAAQSLQQSGKLDQAAERYRAFLADALRILAIGDARNADYTKDASLYDEALVLEPDSPTLRMEYARTALLAGDFQHAETLARACLKAHSNDPHGLAQAHQILGRALLKLNRDQDARKELEAAVALDPNFENGYGLAVVCLDLDDEKCATQIFREMEVSFGDTPVIHMSFGRAHGNSDFSPQAVAEFKKVIAENPRFPGAHYSLAAALLATSEEDATVAAAEKELKNELAITPNDFLTYAALGKMAAIHHRNLEAEKYLKRATALNPKNPDAFLYLGQLYFDTDRLTDAEASLRRAIELTTDEARSHFQVQKAHFLLGRILMQQHRVEEAHAEMQKARAFANKGLSQDKIKLAGTLSDGSETTVTEVSLVKPGATASATQHEADPDAARKLNWLEKRLGPPIADNYNNLGAIAAIGSNYTDALRYFERAAEWNPSLDGLDLNWGRAAFMASRFSEAVTPLSRYLRIHPDDSGIRGALGMTQNYAGCIDTLKAAQENIASIPQMQYVYAESLVKTGQVSSGKERLISLETSHPEIAEVHRGLGEVFELQGDRQKAIDELRRALQLNATDPETHYELGNIELRSGDPAAAIPELESAIKLEPNDPKFHRELVQALKQSLRSADAQKEQRVLDELQSSQSPSSGSGTQPHPK